MAVTWTPFDAVGERQTYIALDPHSGKQSTVSAKSARMAAAQFAFTHYPAGPILHRVEVHWPADLTAMPRSVEAFDVVVQAREDEG